MSTRYMQGFDYIPVGAAVADFVPLVQADGGFGGIDGLNFATGRFGIGTAMTTAPKPGSTIFSQALMHTFNEGYVMGMAVLLTNVLSSLIQLNNSQNGQTALAITFGNLGIISLQAQNGTQYRTATGTYRQGAWFYLEVKHISGLFEVKINGNIVVHATVGVPEPTPFDAIMYRSDFNQGTPAYDDLYINDPSDDGNTDYLGNVTVRSQLVVSNGTHLDLTPVGQGSNFLNANNFKIPYTDYNTTSDVGDYDLYRVNPNISARDIFALQVKGLFYQDDGIQLYGANQFLVGIDGGTLQTGTPLGLNQTAPGSINDYWDKNPNTGLPFTTDQLNNLQIGPLLQGSD